MGIQHIIIVIISALCATVTSKAWNNSNGRTLHFTDYYSTATTSKSLSYYVCDDPVCQQPECEPDPDTGDPVTDCPETCTKKCSEVGSNPNYSLQVNYGGWKTVASGFSKSSSTGFIKYNRYLNKVYMSSHRDYRPDPPLFSTLSFKVRYGNKSSSFTMNYWDCSIKANGWKTYN